MEKQYYDEYRKKIDNLSVTEEQLRNVYLRKLAIGEIEGPMTEYPSFNDTWLSHYNEEDLVFNYAKMSLYDYIFHKNKEHMNDVALRYFGRNISYKKFNKEIIRAAKSFKASGINEGDRVAICMPNTPEAVYALYALNYIGAVAAMIHPKSGELEIKDFVNKSKSKKIVIIDKYASKIEHIIDDSCLENAIVVEPEDGMSKIAKFVSNRIRKYPHFKTKDDRFLSWNDFRNLSKFDHSKLNQAKYYPNRLAVLLRTGGSTGVPKSCRISDDNINSMVDQFFQAEKDFRRGDKLLAVMPIFHGFGLCSSIHLPLSVGVSVNLIPELNKKDLSKHVKEENHIIGVPTLLDAVVNDKECNELDDVSQLKEIVSGGDMDTDNTEINFNKFLRERKSTKVLRKGYGLAQMVAGATFASGTYNDLGSIGIPMVGTKVKLVKPGTDEEVTKEGEVGELCFRGPSVMMGYDDLVATKEAISNGWLHTGDLACFQNSILFFKQRQGDMIINSGVNVYPREIERVLLKHEAVAAAVVIGVYDPYKKEVPKAFIKLKDGYFYNDKMIEEFKHLCSLYLNTYSLPTSYEFVKEFPQTLLGKVDRKSINEKEKTKKLVG